MWVDFGTVKIKIDSIGFPIDWENVTDKNGKVIEYSIDNAIILLKDLPDLKDYLMCIIRSSKIFHDLFNIIR